MFRHCCYKLIQKGDVGALPSLLMRIFTIILVPFTITCSIASGSYWRTDYDLAVEESETSGKPLLIYFTGSDWCLWCHKLDLTLFDSRACSIQLPGLVVPVKLDFPQRRRLPPKEARQNKLVQARHDAEEIPTVILYDPASGQELWRHGYLDTPPETYIEVLRLAKRKTVVNTGR